MPKITFMGAGSTVFAKNVLGDCMMTEALAESTLQTDIHFFRNPAFQFCLPCSRLCFQRSLLHFLFLFLYRQQFFCKGCITAFLFQIHHIASSK